MLPFAGRNEGGLEIQIRAGGAVVWLTGLSSAGKTTIARLVCGELSRWGLKVRWIDGDVVRKGMCRGLGFSKNDRDESVRRIGRAAASLARRGTTVVVSAISPYRLARDNVRRASRIFIEVYVNAPLATCELRDNHGLYRRAHGGELFGVTGVDDPYEPPIAPEVECKTDLETPDASAQRVLAAIWSRIGKRLLP
jgi:adenylyl-sulfate kinase